MKEREKKIWLFGVFSGCPLKNALVGCAFEKYRKLSALERWEYIERLSEEEVDAYILHHRACLYKREQGMQQFCRTFDDIKKTG